MAVRGVLAEAHVRHQQQPWDLRAQRAERALHDPVLLPGAGAFVVLGLGDPEQDHGLNSRAHEPARLLDEIVDGEAAERRELPVRLRRRPDEERHHERVEVEPRLANEPA